jgi:hypothetical protein
MKKALLFLACVPALMVAPATLAQSSHSGTTFGQQWVSSTKSQLSGDVPLKLGQVVPFLAAIYRDMPLPACGDDGVDAMGDGAAEVLRKAIADRQGAPTNPFNCLTMP